MNHSIVQFDVSCVCVCVCSGGGGGGGGGGIGRSNYVLRPFPTCSSLQVAVTHMRRHCLTLQSVDLCGCVCRILGRYV